MSDISSPNADATPPSGSAAPVPPKAPKQPWLRYVMYTLAVLGVLLLALVAVVMYENSKKPKNVAIDETEMIDSLMSSNYGKYSDEHKGWLYVGEGNRTYVVRVVQQAKPSDGAHGDELYFVTSGKPLDGEPGAMYGVFQVRAGEKEEAGKLFQISSPYRYEGTVPLTPENVRFEALSETLWAWVIKVQDGADPKLATVTVNNVVLAPNGDNIAVLAWFRASLASDPGIDCAAAETRYKSWANGESHPRAAATEAAATQGEQTESEHESEHEHEHEVDDVPLRCNDASWAYRTGPVSGAVPVPLTVTAKGVRDGVKMQEKTWKLVFDSKAFSYHVPEALTPE
ncbi:hypothetical protein ACFDR9_002446 [Janthinobacterium sp. CG_23.3]|uniref:hypothetical protein n=1 Tax=Janthinobacterium sp. CG_23.3 TaxID=3349634 RepID=UPI0038D485D3